MTSRDLLEPCCHPALAENAAQPAVAGCSWCDLLLPDVPPPGQKSFGICPRCRAALDRRAASRAQHSPANR